MVNPTTGRENLEVVQRRGSVIVLSQYLHAALMLLYGGPCEAGFCLAGSLGRRILTLARSASYAREKAGRRFLNLSKE